MLVKLKTGTVFGLEILPVDVEVNVSSKGFPTFDIVGLPSRSVSESKARIRSAIVNSGYKFPNKKITVNLSPADIPKSGTNFDLPIALGILCAEGHSVIPTESLVAGELSLDGTVIGTKGSALFAAYATDKNIGNIYLVDKLGLSNLFSSINVFSINSLKEIVEILNKKKAYKASGKNGRLYSDTSKEVNDVIIGQEYAKRALTICAAGGHNILLIGSPGAGKTMLAQYLKSILPPLTKKELIELIKVYSTKNAEIENMHIRPFRSPHHSITSVGLLGGGSNITPGEISLANNGVLFLDEFLEFSSSVINKLRQPLEDGYIEIVRHSGKASLPAKFILVAACNPCPCGYKYSPDKECSCTDNKINTYLQKLSGPIIDRIDLHIIVKPVPIGNISANIMNGGKTKSVSNVLAPVTRARKAQKERLSELGMTCNAEIPQRHMMKLCEPDKTTVIFLEKAATKLNLSARGYFRTLKVARTIADLDKSTKIKVEHVSEAIQYRFE